MSRVKVSFLAQILNIGAPHGSSEEPMTSSITMETEYMNV
jgi:hypothetical protein